ncbi:MAG: preprotein translocase subunit SecE [Candidatus Pacebacteria bacterium]|jgi:preprotein translocase subunit SecE|nr:preprotein translocase subunit SecE [Candidatus Paceibacterota bacterium]MBP9780710.1 preprotein translocase subunit SecE [Candidatus Paceibacterota bacterium]MDQ5949937.1 preprotein translocase subunit SecE [Patescibacteria group bacterium]
MGIFNYFRETKTEMKHVTWPTRKQVISFTVIVIILSLITAVFLGFFDYLFANAIKQLVS